MRTLPRGLERLGMTNSSREPAVLLGLIGAGIQASLTPDLHEQEGGAQGVRTIYKLIDLEALGLAADALPDLLVAAERMASPD